MAATSGSQSAASIELSTGGLPVMAIGGFNNEGGDLTLAQFKAYVAKGEIHYYIASSGMGGAGGGFPGGGGGGSVARGGTPRPEVRRPRPAAGPSLRRRSGTARGATVAAGGGMGDGRLDHADHHLGQGPLQEGDDRRRDRV